MISSFPPSIPLCRVFERTSKKGNTYLTGRLGGARVTILKTDQTDDEGNAIWTILLAEAPHRTDHTKRSAADETAMRRSQEPIDQTPIPF